MVFFWSLVLAFNAGETPAPMGLSLLLELSIASTTQFMARHEAEVTEVTMLAWLGS